MTEETYSPYKLAIELGFTEAEANQLAKAGADATNIRRVAVAKGLLSTKPKLGKAPFDGKGKDIVPLEPELKVEVSPTITPDNSKVVIKKHRHSYRKDGTCRCGAVRKVKA